MITFSEEGKDTYLVGFEETVRLSFQPLIYILWTRKMVITSSVIIFLVEVEKNINCNK